MLYIIGVMLVVAFLMLCAIEGFFHGALNGVKDDKGLTKNLKRHRSTTRKIFWVSVLAFTILFGVLFAFTKLFDGTKRYKRPVTVQETVEPNTQEQVKVINKGNPDTKRSKEKKKEAEEDQKKAVDELDEFMKQQAP